MRHLHATTRFVLPAVAAALLLVPASSATAADPVAPPADSRPAAAKALERAVDVLNGVVTTGKAVDHGRADATMALLDLRKALPSLDRRDRERADALFARPDGDQGYTDADIALDAAWDPNETAAAQIQCAAETCVHWVPDGTLDEENHPSRHGATPAEAQRALDALEHSWSTEIADMGYQDPPSDGSDGAQGLVGQGGKVDVYLSDLLTEDGGVFGYAVPEWTSDESNARATGYMVIDNDMAEAATAKTTAEELAQVTTAHEFFHLVQFGYDFWEHPWFMESTATWMEEQVYDDVNDNRDYIGAGSLVWTQRPLDTTDGSAEYATWVFHELYTHMLKTDDVVREAWEYAAEGQNVDFDNESTMDARVNFRWALNKALLLHGWDLARSFSSFGGSSVAPQITRDGVGVYYPEGKEGNYPSAKPTGSWFLSTSKRGLDWMSISLKHWAGATAEFKPASSLAGAWKLGIKIDNPPTQSAAYAITFYKDGTAPRLMSLALNSSGDASITVPFDYRKVARVVIYQGNTSPSDGKVVKFRASTFK